MGKFIDLTGKVFGRLTVLERAENHIQPNGVKVVRWKCICDCGKEIITSGQSLRRGYTQSCGCFHKDCAKDRGYKNKKYNVYDLSGEYGVGYTLKNEVFYFDKEDYDLIKNYCWFMDRGYIVTNDPKTRKEIRFHRLVMKAPKGLFVDHKNHQRNDNRKNNLRIVTCAQNNMNKGLSSKNKSGVLGVYFQDNSWCAEISVHNKRIFLGRFKNKDDAIIIRKKAEEKFFGEYSYDNSLKINDDLNLKNNTLVEYEMIKKIKELYIFHLLLNIDNNISKNFINHLKKCEEIIKNEIENKQ